MEQEGKPDVTFEVDKKELRVYAPDRRNGVSTYKRSWMTGRNITLELARRTERYIGQGYQPASGFHRSRVGWVFERGPMDQERLAPFCLAFKSKPDKKAIQNAFFMASLISVPWASVTSNSDRKMVFYEAAAVKRTFDVRGALGAFSYSCNPNEALAAYLWYLGNCGLVDMIVSAGDAVVLVDPAAIPESMEATTGLARSTLNLLGLTKPEFTGHEFAEAIHVSGRPALVL